jgi:hypothetical protein
MFLIDWLTTDNESAAGRRHMETMQALSMKFPTDIIGTPELWIGM